MKMSMVMKKRNDMNKHYATPNEAHRHGTGHKE